MFMLTYRIYIQKGFLTRTQVKVTDFIDKEKLQASNKALAFT